MSEHIDETIKRFLDAIEKENDGKTLDFVIPGYLGKPVVAYQSMRYDLMLCRDAILELLNNPNNDVVKTCILHTVIILYGKCFTDSTAAKLPKLEVSDFDGDKNLIGLHEKMMNARHNFVAHRGSTEFELGFAYISLGTENLDKHVKIKQTKRKTFTPEECVDYLTLIDFLISVVEMKLDKTAPKIWKHLLDNFTPKQLSHLKIAGPTVDVQKETPPEKEGF